MPPPFDTATWHCHLHGHSQLPRDKQGPQAPGWTWLMNKLPTGMQNDPVTDQYCTVMAWGGGMEAWGKTPRVESLGASNREAKTCQRKPIVCSRSLEAFLEGSSPRGTTNPSRILQSVQCCGAAPVVRRKHHLPHKELLEKLTDDKSLLGKRFLQAIKGFPH